MNEIISTVRLLKGRWVGACPDCKRDDVPMKKWEYELRAHNVAQGGARCSGSGKFAVNVDEAADVHLRDSLERISEGETRRSSGAAPLEWVEEAPGQHFALWWGSRIYVVLVGDTWTIRRPGFPNDDVSDDGTHSLEQVKFAAMHAFAV